MPRVPLVDEGADGLTASQQQLIDHVVSTRGRMIRPFEVLAHVPTLGLPLSELGAGIRFAGGLSDHDRELVILTASSIHGCTFEWESHLPIARQAGVSDEAIDHLREGSGEPTQDEAALIGFVRELCSTATVGEEAFVWARHRFGETGVVELATVVGYYTLLAFVMGVVDAC